MRSLSTGAIIPWFNLNREVIKRKEILQVLSIESSTKGKYRYKCVLSDGEVCIKASCSSQTSIDFEKGRVKPNSLIAVSDFSILTHENKSIFLILDMEWLEDAPGIIGNPQERDVSLIDRGEIRINHSESIPQYKPAAATTKRKEVSSTGKRPASTKDTSSTVEKPAETNGPESDPNDSTKKYKVSWLDNPFGASFPEFKANGELDLSTTSERHIAPSLATSVIIPIHNITEEYKGVAVKAYVKKKSEMKEWDKGPNNKGRLFTIDIVDAAGGEIKGTFFRKVADEYFNRMVVGQTYTFYGATVQAAKRVYQTNSHPCELVFGENAVISSVLDGTAIVPSDKVVLNRTMLVTIATKKTLPVVADILGVCITPLDLKAFKKKGPDGSTTESVYGSFMIIDESKYPITITLFDQSLALVPKMIMHRFIGIKNARVSTYKDMISAKLGSSSELILDPEGEQSESLRSWYEMNRDSNLVRNFQRGKDVSKQVVFPMSEISGPILPLSEYCTLPVTENLKTLYVKVFIKNCLPADPIQKCFVINDHKWDVVRDDVANEWKLKSTGDRISSPEILFRINAIISDDSCVNGVSVLIPSGVVEYLSGETAIDFDVKIHRDVFELNRLCDDLFAKLTGRECIFKISVLQDKQDQGKKHTRIKAIYI